MSQYLLWSGQFQGWTSKISGYTTDREEAKTFTREEALARCRQHKNGGTFRLLPISITDLESI
jgi:hypothetical protein